MKLLIITAVSQEQSAVLRGLNDTIHDVKTVGIGPAAAAAKTAKYLAEAQARGERYDGVINAGIAGGFPERTEPGELVVGTTSTSAELGVRLTDRFQPVDELGFGSNSIACDPALTSAIAARRGHILTLATITGTPTIAQRLAQEHPRALAEAMEGFGVATAAVTFGLPFAEIRSITNAVGDRDVSGWRWEAGFDALAKAASDLSNV